MKIRQRVVEPSSNSVEQPNTSAGWTGWIAFLEQLECLIAQNIKTLRAERTATTSGARRPRFPWPITANPDQKIVTYEGKSFSVSFETADFVRCLIDAWPDWISARKKGFTKASRIKEGLPADIAEKIEGVSGMGQRFRWPHNHERYSDVV